MLPGCRLSVGGAGAAARLPEGLPQVLRDPVCRPEGQERVLLLGASALGCRLLPAYDIASPFSSVGFQAQPDPPEPVCLSLSSLQSPDGDFHTKAGLWLSWKPPTWKASGWEKLPGCCVIFFSPSAHTPGLIHLTPSALDSGSHHGLDAARTEGVTID